MIYCSYAYIYLLSFVIKDSFITFYYILLHFPRGGTDEVIYIFFFFFFDSAAPTGIGI